MALSLIERMIPSAMLPEKPRFTHPCNHCGICCRTQLCEIAPVAFPGAQAPCPGLVISEGKAMCSLVLVEAATGIEPMVTRGLGIGTGCSMPDEETTDDEIERFDNLSRIKVFGPLG